MRVIYLDNAATTLYKPPCVVQAVAEAMTSIANSARGAYGSSLDAARVLYGAREKCAALFGLSHPERVCFTMNSTEALNIAINGTLTPADHVISTDCEHNSVLRPLYRLREAGMGLDFVPADRRGDLDYDDLARLLRPNTRAVVCTHASNLTGNVLDLARIGSFCCAHGLLFLVDASQTAGVLPIDMERLHISILCFTGHKSLHGPQGTGGLCVAPGVDVRPWCVGGTGVQTHLEHQPEQYPAHLEAGTRNGHGIAGLSAALDYITGIGLETICAHEAALARRFYDGVRAIPGVTVYGDFTQPVRAPIVTLNLAGFDCAELADILWADYGIATRAGAHCAPRLHRALGTEQTGSVRFSFGYENTQEEVDAALSALRHIAEE